MIRYVGVIQSCNCAHVTLKGEYQIVFAVGLVRVRAQTVRGGAWQPIKWTTVYRGGNPSQYFVSDVAAPEKVPVCGGLGGPKSLSMVMNVSGIGKFRLFHGQSFFLSKMDSVHSIPTEDFVAHLHSIPTAVACIPGSPHLPS